MFKYVKSTSYVNNRIHTTQEYIQLHDYLSSHSMDNGLYYNIIIVNTCNYSNCYSSHAKGCKYCFIYACLFENCI